MKFALLALAAGAVTLAACGRGDAPSDAAPPVTGTPASAAPATPVAPIPGEIPADTPAFLRPVDGAVVTSSATYPGGGTFDYDTTAPVETATTLHRQAALDAGQTLTMDVETGDGHMLASGDRDGFAINIGRRGTGSHVSISWNNLPAG